MPPFQPIQNTHIDPLLNLPYQTHFATSFCYVICLKVYIFLGGSFVQAPYQQQCYTCFRLPKAIPVTNPINNCKVCIFCFWWICCNLDHHCVSWRISTWRPCDIFLHIIVITWKSQTWPAVTKVLVFIVADFWAEFVLVWSCVWSNNSY